MPRMDQTGFGIDVRLTCLEGRYYVLKCTELFDVLVLKSFWLYAAQSGIKSKLAAGQQQLVSVEHKLYFQP